MPRLQRFFECVARALSAPGAPTLARHRSCGESLLRVARDTHKDVARCLSEPDLQAALREAVSAPQETFELGVQDALAGVETADPNLVQAYLELLQPVVRQALRRPGDPAGTSVPGQLRFATPDDWLIFFPDRLTCYSAGDRPTLDDVWHLADLRGIGPFGEAWQALPDDPAHGASLLKFVTDAEAGRDFVRHEAHFRSVLELEPMAGLVPLRSVHLLADPPCLESAFVTGYDLAGLVRDWRWRDEQPKPAQVAAIIRRVAKIVGHLHELRLPVVHGGLKPSNVLLHPTPDGKVTVWVSDVGWGPLSSELAARHGDRRQALRGSQASLYLSPGQTAGRHPEPADDVYALGVIWYQMLKRDLTAAPPAGAGWADSLKEHGLTDGQARLIEACVDPHHGDRPANGSALAARIDADAGKSVSDHGSRTFTIAGSGSHKAVAPQLRRTDPLKHGPAPAAKQAAPPSVANRLGMQFVRIEPGTFLMGSPAGEAGRRDWEGPPHEVRMTKPFYLGVYPVTQAQYEVVARRNPSHHTRLLGGGPNHPVEQVSWNDAVEFCRLLSSRDAGHAYRLPTEAEWEYACRAGTTTPFSFGETVTLKEVHFFGLNAGAEATTAGKTAKAGDRPANPWGLYDMHGNVMEWCQDWWSEDYYAEAPPEDPPGPASGRLKVARGGSFSQFSAECRSAARLGRSPASRLNMIGFRVVRGIT